MAQSDDLDLYAVLTRISFGIEVVSTQCAGSRLSFYTRLWLAVGSMLVLCAVTMLGPLLVMARTGTSFQDTLALADTMRALRDLFVLVLLLYPSISGMAMEFFRCQRIDGVPYMMARDHPLDSSWHSDTHSANSPERC